MAKPNSRTNPLRLAKNREEFEAHRRDKKRPVLGVTGTAFAGEEATVVISAETPGWHYMDVEYAKLIHNLLGQSIKAAKQHNRSLRR